MNMNCKKGITPKSYIITNVLIALMVVNIFVFGPLLRMGRDFTAGMETGMIAAWIAYAAFGAWAFRRKGVTFDERAALILGKAGAVSCWSMIFLGSVLQVVLRSESLAVSMSAAEAVAWVCDGGLLSFAAAFLVIWLRS
jgi:hypothetical protein